MIQKFIEIPVQEYERLRAVYEAALLWCDIHEEGGGDEFLWGERYERVVDRLVTAVRAVEES